MDNQFIRVSQQYGNQTLNGFDDAWIWCFEHIYINNWRSMHMKDEYGLEDDEYEAKFKKESIALFMLAT